MRSLKRRLALAFIAAGVMVQACGEPPPPAKPVIRPVRYVIAQAAGGQRTRTFSGVARAGVSSTISFRVAGTIVAVDVAVGDRVNPGALLAALDPVDYELQVQETEASLRQAEARATNAGRRSAAGPQPLRERQRRPYGSRCGHSNLRLGSGPG